jgi:hypothetical protein
MRIAKPVTPALESIPVFLEIRQGRTCRFALRPGFNQVGRAIDNMIQLDDPSVSGHHCVIETGLDGIWIRDLGSTNGTFIGGQPVQAAPLQQNQPFRLGNVECILSAETAPQNEPAHGARSDRRHSVNREGRKALSLGFGLALVVLLIPPLAYILDFLRLIIHETGHTVTAWFFGYPTIPVLIGGGAVSAQLSRPHFMVLVMLGVIGRLLYSAHRRRRYRVLGALGAAVYLLFAFTPLGQLTIIIMGHGAELVIASLFLYRALSGRSIVHSAERPLYAMVAVAIIGLDLRFAMRLLFGAGAAMEYREGLDGHTHDLVRIADNYLHVGLSSVVFVFLLLCLLAPAAAFVYFRKRGYCACPA